MKSAIKVARAASSVSTTHSGPLPVRLPFRRPSPLACLAVLGRLLSGRRQISSRPTSQARQDVESAPSPMDGTTGRGGRAFGWQLLILSPPLSHHHHHLLPYFRALRDVPHSLVPLCRRKGIVALPFDIGSCSQPKGPHSFGSRPHYLRRRFLILSWTFVPRLSSPQC